MKKKPSLAELEEKIRQLEAKVVERKTADNAVDLSGQFYKHCIESAPYGIMVHDDKGRILIFNSQLEKISGYRQEEIPDVKTWIEKLYPDEEYRKLVVEARKKAGSQEKLRKREAILTTKAGDKSLCQFSSLLLKSGIRIVFIKNVAEQRQAEELLHESEERFRLLSEAAIEAIIIHKDGVLLKANDQFFKMFGYHPEELLGTQVVPRVIAGESIEVVKKKIESKVSTPYEAMGRRKDGNKFPILCHAKMIKYQGSEVRVVTISDLSYQKKSEHALREREENFRTVSEQSPNMIFINKDGKVVYANQKCVEMMGYKRDEFYSPEFDFLTLIAPESIDIIRSNLKDVISPMAALFLQTIWP